MKVDSTLLLGAAYEAVTLAVLLCGLSFLDFLYQLQRYCTKCGFYTLCFL